MPEGVYDLIDDTLSVVKMTAETIIFDAVIEVLEDRRQGRSLTPRSWSESRRLRPALAPTVKDYLAKPDPASWIAMLISILMLRQSSSAPSPPSAEEIANAIWEKDHPGHVAVPIAGYTPPRRFAKPRPRQPPKVYGKSKRRKSKKRR